MTKVSIVLFLLALVSLGCARWAGHEYTPEVSAQVANAIKQKL